MTTPDDVPYVLMIGMDLPPGASTEQRLAFSDGYSQIHTPEVVESHPGFVRGTRFELVDPDPRGDLGPQWVVVYEIATEAAARLRNRASGTRVNSPHHAPAPARLIRTTSPSVSPNRSRLAYRARSAASSSPPPR